MNSVRLDQFVKREGLAERHKLVLLVWLITQALFVSSWQPSSWLRIACLRLFGAHIGQGVVMKPHVRVKYPWKLRIGNYSWVGESVWIDNLVEVSIGSSCCLSQGVYLCTGNHDWSKSTFDLITKPIALEESAWLGAFSRVSPGVVVGQAAVLTMGSVTSENLEPFTVYSGNPAMATRTREIRAE
ncbi:MAG: WcaF family extracellular polysaccharide biosynthesis acetyltransferase [Pseudomonadota bacterium]